jgi:hypothetical protein
VSLSTSVKAPTVYPSSPSSGARANSTAVLKELKSVKAQQENKTLKEKLEFKCLEVKQVKSEVENAKKDGLKEMKHAEEKERKGKKLKKA